MPSAAAIIKRIRVIQTRWSNGSIWGAGTAQRIATDSLVWACACMGPGLRPHASNTM